MAEFPKCATCETVVEKLEAQTGKSYVKCPTCEGKDGRPGKLLGEIKDDGKIIWYGGGNKKAKTAAGATPSSSHAVASAPTQPPPPSELLQKIDVMDQKLTDILYFMRNPDKTAYTAPPPAPSSGPSA